MKKIIAILALSLVFPAAALAHEKKLDNYGCHYAKKNRQGEYTEYHCHRGPLSGEKYRSQKAMLRELKRKGHHWKPRT